MEIIKDYRIYPTRFDMDTIEARLKRMEPICREIIQALSPDDRAVLEEYLKLLREREVLAQQNAYHSGIQIGERRTKRGI